MKCPSCKSEKDNIVIDIRKVDGTNDEIWYFTRYCECGTRKEQWFEVHQKGTN
jgi:transcriptional regulator NrdR family protein